MSKVIRGSKNQSRRLKKSWVKVWSSVKSLVKMKLELKKKKKSLHHNMFLRLTPNSQWDFPRADLRWTPLRCQMTSWSQCWTWWSQTQIWWSQWWGLKVWIFQMINWKWWLGWWPLRCWEWHLAWSRTRLCLDSHKLLIWQRTPVRWWKIQICWRWSVKCFEVEMKIARFAKW